MRHGHAPPQYHMSRTLSIPHSLDTVSPEWIHQALTYGGLQDLPPLHDISLTELGEKTSPLAKVARCKLVFSESARHLPESIVVKLASSRRRTRLLSRMLGVNQREVAFYKVLAPLQSVASPKMYYGAFRRRDQRFVLLLEDLGHLKHADEEGDMYEQQQVVAVRMLAELHARNWNRTDVPPLNVAYDRTRRRSLAASQMLYQIALPNAVEFLDGKAGPHLVRLMMQYGSKVAAHRVEMAAGTKTLVHGDFRRENLLFGVGDSELDDAVVIDWQMCGKDGALFDLAYFLALGLAVKQRRALEHDCVKEYHATLCRLGVSGLSFDDCWRRYRQAMLAMVMALVVMCGRFDRSNELVLAFVRKASERLLAAIEDLDVAEFLPGRPRRFSIGAGLGAAANRRGDRRMRNP